MLIFYKGGHGNLEDDDWYSEENDFQYHIIHKGKGWHLSPGLETPETILSNTVHYCLPQRDCALVENKSSSGISFQTTLMDAWWLDKQALWKGNREPASGECCRNLLQSHSSQRLHDWTLTGIKVFCSKPRVWEGSPVFTPWVHSLPFKVFSCLTCSTDHRLLFSI